MKRIGRLIFDLIGLALAVIAIAFGVVTVTGQIPNWTHLSSIKEVADAGWTGRDVLKEVHPEAFWMGVVALALGAIAALVAVVSIIMVFRAKSHIKMTIFVWVISWVAAGLAAYALHRYLNIDTADIYKHFNIKN